MTKQKLSNTNSIAVHENLIMRKIYFLRGQKVMLDADIAALYGIETKRLKEQVRRNTLGFHTSSLKNPLDFCRPKHFMFEITKQENEILKSQFTTSSFEANNNKSLRSQIATLKRGEHIKYQPYAFTEHGILMLSNIIKSKKAIEISIKIIDVFVKLREVLFNNTELRLILEQVSKKTENNFKNIELVFQYLDELMQKHEEQKIKTLSKNKIGFQNTN